MEMEEHNQALVTEIYHAAFQVTVSETVPLLYAKLTITREKNIFTFYGTFSNSISIIVHLKVSH